MKVDLKKQKSKEASDRPLILSCSHSCTISTSVTEDRLSQISVYPWLYSPCGPWPLFQFLDLHTVGRTPSAGDQLVVRPLPNTNRHLCLERDSKLLSQLSSE
jgi:hypothetical protein